MSWQKACPLWFEKSGHIGRGQERSSTKRTKQYTDFSISQTESTGLRESWWQSWEELDCTKWKAVAIDLLHVKFHKVRNRKPLPQNQPVLYNMQEPHPGMGTPGATFGGRSMSQVLQKSGENEYCPSKHCWREWMVIVSPVVLLCLLAFKEYAQECVRTPASKSFFCRRWFKPIQVQPN